MALRTTYTAESWDKIYQAFAAVSFVSYDFDAIKQSLVDYTRTYYPEQFNDYIQSSEFIAMLEMFAYIAEQLAYRVDMVAHENFITTAQRKQSILRLAKLISYKATRNIPVRGLVKLNSISTTERVLDSRGVNLAGLTITWNDANNSNWKEQFTLVMNRVLASRFGQPTKTIQIGDVVMDLYSLKNDPASFKNGVFAYTAATGTESFQMEIVPADVDTNGPFEREPDLTSSLSLIYANDGIGDGSDYTGFLLFTKQGTLNRIDYQIDAALPDRRLDFAPENVNHTDVWVQKLASTGSISERWKQVDTVSEQNLVFNDVRSTRKKFEVDTRENDQITVIFGDGDFSDAPVGTFRFWMRQSANRSLVIQKNRIVNQSMGFGYTSTIGNAETCTMTFSLTSTLQNGSATESIEHIRRSAPSTYYAQNRMVNGQDYNTYLLKDPTILRLKTINRTFAGQPKYIDWNDASGSYENVKLFGDDLVMKYQIGLNTLTTSVSGKSLIDEVIEPLLKTSGVVNTLLHISADDIDTRGIVSAPRRKFIEDNRSRYKDKNGVDVAVFGAGDGSLKEKTAMQGLIDRHWYGEPLSRVLDASSTLLGVIPDPGLYPEDDSRIYDATLPRTIDGVNKYPPGDIGSGLQPVAEQNYFGLRYNRMMRGIGNGKISIVNGSWVSQSYWLVGEVFTIEVQADGLTIAVRSNLRGSFPTGSIGDLYSIQPTGFSVAVPMFTVTQGSTVFAAGDAFVLDTTGTGALTRRVLSASNEGTGPVNLNGWWEIMGASTMPDYASGMQDPQLFTMSESMPSIANPSIPNLKQHSWTIFVRKIRQSVGGLVIGYEVHYRDLKLTVKSPTTKFWFNEVDQILDGNTKKRVFDNVKILGSNIASGGTTSIKKNQTYDVVGAVRNSNGVIDFSQLEIVPTDLLQEDSSGDLIPDRLLQFETFAVDSYEYYKIGVLPIVYVAADPTPGGWSVGATINNDLTYGRNLRMPALVGSNTGLDFMWQHFSPFTNIIDPSVTNIHDAYVMTRGYYDNVISYVRGTTVSAPSPMTPLELRNTYGYLLESKMLSDTVVLHSGKLRLLFGGLAEPQLRAKFKVIRAQGATLTNERIKEEVLNVVNTFFDIDGWDFGDTFYATELISLIHQRLPADVASVVLVPTYSTNSFGSMFTVESGVDEILQSAAELGDIEVVEALTPTVIRQVK
jgi:hypothetical protein